MHFIAKLFVACSALATASASATTYSKEVERQTKCESAGSVARSHHGISQDELRAAVSGIQKKMDKKEITKKLGGDTQYLIWVGYSASSPKEAFMKGWGWCMDQNK